MKRRHQIVFPGVIFLIWLSLVGCRNGAARPGTPWPDPAAVAVSPPPVQPTAPATPTTAAATTAAATTAAPAPPDWSPLDTAWTDRQPFAAGLIASQRAVLSGLSGAPVYHLQLEIDAGLTTVAGRQALYYTNRTGAPLTELPLYLYPNLLGGSLNVSELEANGQPVASRLDAGGSLLWVPLPAPLAAGEPVVIGLTFSLNVPTTPQRNYGVLATVDGVLALAHFYPAVAVHDDAGWRTELPDIQGDVTYAETGFYLVEVSAPADLQMASSGVVVAAVTTGARQRLRYAAGPMRDFYLAASRAYESTSRTVGDTVVTSYAPAGFAAASAAVLDYAAAALQAYSRRFGPYPFVELDIVATPTLALGVEYPGIIANSIRLYAVDTVTGDLADRRRLESTTAHEVGHQWFYGLVGNDQRREPWLDEALTQYATALYFRDTGGPAAEAAFFQSMEANWSAVAGAEIPIGLPVADYQGVEYAAIVYGRGPLFFRRLAQVMGQMRLDAALRDYVARYRWQLASGDDFQAVAEAACSCNLAPLFQEWIDPAAEQ